MKIAILGAECTGKRTLAQALSAQLKSEYPRVLLSDTAPLMTAVYSDVVLGDRSHYPLAMEHHRASGLTLVTATDLPWAADGRQPDGLAMRAQVNQRLREVLAKHSIGFSLVFGMGEARTQNALQAIRYALGTPRPNSPRSNWMWPCEKCSDPQCEHRLFSGLLHRTT